MIRQASVSASLRCQLHDSTARPRCQPLGKSFSRQAWVAFALVGSATTPTGAMVTTVDNFPSWVGHS